MTRAEAYAEGFHEGRRWAEEDIRAQNGRENPLWPYGGMSGDAYRLGAARGYRDTWARWDAGTLTASMLEHAPLGA